MIYTSYHRKNNPTYLALKKRVGFNRFHIYNILPENPPKSEIDRLRGELQSLKWDDLVTVRGRAQVRIRGTLRWVSVYQFK